jgi:signal transduction histidine kinase
LGAILRNAEAAAMLLEAPVPDIDELRAIVADIRKDDRRAGDVIDRLYTLLRRRSVELRPVTVEGLVQDVIALVRADAAARHVALEFVAAPDLPIALGDRVHLSQVLLNLIINGMDAVSESREGSRRVVIDARRGDDGMLEVAVTDSGHGLAREVASKVFDPFFTTKAHGMGMGLPVSRTIVEAHGGKLWAESDATHGATFRFTLRVAEVAPP